MIVPCRYSPLILQSLNPILTANSPCILKENIKYAIKLCVLIKVTQYTNVFLIHHHHKLILIISTGVWFMHCHLERHLSWGMDTTLIVTNGPTPNTKLLPPPPYMPPC